MADLSLLDYSIDLLWSCLEDRALLHPSVNSFAAEIQKITRRGGTTDRVRDAWQNMPVYLQIYAAELARKHDVQAQLTAIVGELPSPVDFRQRRPEPMF